MLCQKTALKIAASLPCCLVAELETTIDCASIILPITPPVEFAAPIRMGLKLSCCAVTFCRLPNKAFDPASVPVSATPSQPSKVPKNGYNQPDPVKLRPMIVSMPQYLVK